MLPNLGVKSLIPSSVIVVDGDDTKKLLDNTDDNELTSGPKTKTLIDIGNLLTVGNLIASGLKKSENSDVLYVRKEGKRMMDVLDNMTTSKPIQFQGCPGVGKSTTLFAYLNLPEVADKGYLWIHFEGDDCSIIHRKASGDIISTGVHDIHYAYLKELVRSVSDIEFIVLDGVANDGLHSNLFATAGKRNDVKVVSCTSRGAKSFRTELAAKMGWPKKVTVDSWTFEEYEAAFNAGLPALQMRYKSLNDLEEAYFYSGGSIRFMCSDIEEVISTVDDKFKSVSDYSLLLRGLEGDQSSGSVNTLMQIFNDKSVPLSQYVCKKLAGMVDDAFILAAEKVNVNNPAWLGWVFEMKVIKLIQKGREPFSIINSTDGSSVS